MLGATMPETPVNKNGHTLAAENKIRLAKKSLMSSPTDNATSTEKFGEGKLGLLVATPANARHDLRTLRHCKNVRHTN